MVDTINIELNYEHRPVANLTALKIIDTTSIVDGVSITVNGYGSGYFVKSSTATADDVTVVQPTVGGGRWFFPNLLDASGALTTSKTLTVGNLIDSGLTGSSLIGCSSGKQLISIELGSSIAYEENTLDTVQNLTTSGSPTFANITNSGVTANSVAGTDVYNKFIALTLGSGMTLSSGVLNSVIQTSSSSGNNFYLDDTTIVPTGTQNSIQVNTLTKIPVTSTSEQTDTVTLSSTTSPVIIEAYLYNTALGRTAIDAGQWFPTTYASSTNAANSSITVNAYTVSLATSLTPGVTFSTTTASGTSSTVTASSSIFTPGMANANRTLCYYLQTPKGLYQISAYNSGTVVTITVPPGYTSESTVVCALWVLAFSTTTGTLTTTLTRYNPLYVESSLPLYTTDKFGLIYFAVTSSAISRSISYTHNGSTHYSYIETPISSLHDDLAGVALTSSTENYGHLGFGAGNIYGPKTLYSTWQYNAHPTFTPGSFQLADIKYVDDAIISGTKEMYLGNGGAEYYPDNTSIVAYNATTNFVAVKTLANSPTGGTEVLEDLTITSADGVRPISCFRTSAGAGIATIPNDIISQRLYAYVDNATGTPNIRSNIYKCVVPYGTIIGTSGSGTTRNAIKTDIPPFIISDANSDITLCAWLETPQGIYPIKTFNGGTNVDFTVPVGYVNEGSVPIKIWRIISNINYVNLSDINTLYNYGSIKDSVTLASSDHLGIIYFCSTSNATGTEFIMSHNGFANNSSFRLPIIPSILNINQTTGTSTLESGIYFNTSSMSNRWKISRTIAAVSNFYIGNTGGTTAITFNGSTPLITATGSFTVNGDSTVNGAETITTTSSVYALNTSNPYGSTVWNMDSTAAGGHQWIMYSGAGLDFVLSDLTGSHIGWVVDGSGYFRADGVYSATTTNAANINVGSDGYLRRSTCGDFYKDDFTPLDSSIDTSGVLKLNMLSFHSVSFINGKRVIDTTELHHSLIGNEEMERYLKQAIIYEDAVDENGNTIKVRGNINDRFILSCLQDQVKKMNERLISLENE